MQYNKITGAEYQGRNQAELTACKASNNFTSDAWLTFLQAKSLNLKVKKGSKSVSIFCGFKEFTNTDKDGKVKTENRPVGFAHVFNLDQTEAYELTK